MTPDDKRRLTLMPHFVGPGPETDSAAGTIRFLRRLLDEATAERDAAMAALRELTTMLRVRPDMAARIGPKEIAIFYHAEAVLAAHSAATTEEVSR